MAELFLSRTNKKISQELQLHDFVSKLEEVSLQWGTDKAKQKGNINAVLYNI